MSQLPASTDRNPGPADLLRWQGTINRVPYVALGTSLLAIKYAIDLSVAELIFHRHWEIWNYIFPGQSLDFLALTAADRDFFIVLIMLSLPFIWIGVVLTMRRLRSAGMPVFLAKLFFVPLINVIMFIILSVLPEQKQIANLEADTTVQASPNEESDLPSWPKPQRPRPGALVRSIENNFKLDGLMALIKTVPAGLALIWLGTACLQSYGWSLFLGIPFVVGMSSAFLFGAKETKSMLACQGIAALATVMLGASIFLWAWEGAVCLLMASPIAFALAAMGAFLGYYLQRRDYTSAEQKLLMMALVLCVPTLMGAEYASHPVPPLIGVISTVDIAAPPAMVWNNVIAFPELPAPTDPLFHLGVAYPVGATISGHGVGALRRCRFSTGAFIEPITVWDQPHLLKFGVQSQPPTMREWSWMHEIHPAHLQGYLQVHSGQFKLTPLVTPSGISTRLEGTTWYQNRMWPNSYWRLWSDNIIHRIHLRVLEHIKQTSQSS